MQRKAISLLAMVALTWSDAVLSEECRPLLGGRGYYSLGAFVAEREGENAASGLKSMLIGNAFAIDAFPTGEVCKDDRACKGNVGRRKWNLTLVTAAHVIGHTCSGLSPSWPNEDSAKAAKPAKLFLLPNLNSRNYSNAYVEIDPTWCEAHKAASDYIPPNATNPESSPTLPAVQRAYNQSDARTDVYIFQQYFYLDTKTYVSPFSVVPIPRSQDDHSVQVRGVGVTYDELDSEHTVTLDNAEVSKVIDTGFFHPPQERKMAYRVTKIATYGGQSGSPVGVVDSNKRFITFGVLTNTASEFGCNDYAIKNGWSGTSEELLVLCNNNIDYQKRVSEIARTSVFSPITREYRQYLRLPDVRPFDVSMIKELLDDYEANPDDAELKEYISSYISGIPTFDQTLVQSRLLRLRQGKRIPNGFFCDNSDPPPSDLSR